MKKILVILVLCLVLSGCRMILLPEPSEEVAYETFGTKPVQEPPALGLMYSRAMDLLTRQEYSQAWELFLELGDYRDAAEYAARFRMVENVLLQSVEQSRVPGAEPVTVSYSYDREGRLMGKEFVSQGTVIESLSYLEDGRLAIRKSPQGSYHLMYDGDLKLKGSIEQTVDDSGWDILTTLTYQLDETGRLVGEQGDVMRIPPGEGKGITEARFRGTYTYDEADRLTCYVREYTQGPVRDYREDYTYDSRGLLVEKISRDIREDYTDTTREFWGYDEQGNLALEEYQCIRVTAEGSREILSESQTYYFLENGLLTGGQRREGDEVTEISYVYGDRVTYIPPEEEGA